MALDEDWVEASEDTVVLALEVDCSPATAVAKEEGAVVSDWVVQGAAAWEAA